MNTEDQTLEPIPATIPAGYDIDIAVPPGYMVDSKGRLVPERLVRPEIKLEDQTVRAIIGFARDLSDQIARFKGHTFDDIATFKDLLAEKYGASKGGAKGGLVLTSFDGCLQVRLQVSDFMTFGPGLQIVKGLIDECINDWDAGEEMRALVNHAFKVDKEGAVNREAIFALRNLEIDDDRWRQIQQAITDAIRITGSKAYPRFYQRDTPEDKWRAITIDLAAA